MIKYFKELLSTLMSINTHLNEIRKQNQEQNEYLCKLYKCVKTSDRSYGDKTSISTTHWNDN